VPRMHFNNGFALRWMSINGGVAALLTKLRFKRNAKKTFRRLISRRKHE